MSIMGMNALEVRNLKEDDLKQVIELDEMSGNNVEDWIESDGTFGIFFNEILLGYLTLGWADDCGLAIENHPAHTYDSRMLSNVYVRKEWRGRGVGNMLINEAFLKIQETTFLSFAHDNLQSYYESLGFKLIEDNHMIRVC